MNKLAVEVTCWRQSDETRGGCRGESDVVGGNSNVTMAKLQSCKLLNAKVHDRYPTWISDSYLGNIATCHAATECSVELRASKAETPVGAPDLNEHESGRSFSCKTVEVDDCFDVMCAQPWNRAKVAERKWFVGIAVLS